MDDAPKKDEEPTLPISESDAALPMELEVVGTDVSDASDKPVFSSEQVAFLLQSFGTHHEPVATNVQKQPRATSRAGYNSSFGWMHLFSKDNMLDYVLIAGLICFTIVFAPVAPHMSADSASSSFHYPQVALLILTACVLASRILVKWRFSRLYTTTTHVVYAVRQFWPLLIFTSVQKARITKIDADVYKKNFIETIFGMNSGTLSLDTAADDDKGFKDLMGVKNIQALIDDIN